MPFKGKVNSEGINIRSDASTSSVIICKVSKGELLEVALERYDWYKVRLPKTAPCFIKNGLASVLEDRIETGDKVNPDFSGQAKRTARIIKERVNLRLSPGESAPILGHINKDEVVIVLEDSAGWFRIEPPKDSYGWIHKRFVDEVALKDLAKDEPKKAPAKDDNITVTGMIRPYGKVFFRLGTHKLVAEDNKIFLLKSSRKGELDPLNYHKARVSGKIITQKEKGLSVIEVEKIEALD